MPGGQSSMVPALLLLALISLAAAEPMSLCSKDQGNYLAGSKYETNVNLLLGTLQQNASSSPSLFASRTLGAVPDTVWGLVLCRGDVSADVCSSCVAAAGPEAKRICNRSRDVALCYGVCYVRLSNQDFLAPTDSSGEFYLNSAINVDSNDVQGYVQAVTGLLNATVQYAVHNSSTLFATGKWVGPDPGFPNIYSVAQCAADLTALQCQSCLQGFLSNWWTMFPPKARSAWMAGPRCTLRSRVSPFYTGKVMVLLGTTSTAATRGSHTIAIVIGLVVALVMVASLAAGLFWRRRYRSRRQHKTQVKSMVQIQPATSNSTTTSSSGTTENENGQQGDSEEDVPRNFPYEALVQATGNFAQKKKLGQGAFGAVYEGTLAGIDTAVAIKEILDMSSDQTKKAFDSEIKIMRQLHHRNILSLKGWCKEDKHLLLIYEIMENGSLEDHLYPKNGTMDMVVYGETDNGTRPSSHLSWPIRHNIIIGIASGLAYLHKECRSAVMHRDLKPANVMLDRNWNAKLADFGLVTQLRHTQTSRNTDYVIGTPSYIDPAYVDTGKVSGQGDVYSLGVVLLEIVCGEKPIIQQDGKNSLIEKVRECDVNNRILDAAERGLRGQYDKQIEAVLRLGLSCVLPKHHNRPHAGRVKDRLTELLPNGKGLTASASQPSEGAFGTCRTTFRTPSHADEEAGVSWLLSG